MRKFERSNHQTYSTVSLNPSTVLFWEACISEKHVLEPARRELPALTGQISQPKAWQPWQPRLLAHGIAVTTPPRTHRGTTTPQLPLSISCAMTPRDRHDETISKAPGASKFEPPPSIKPVLCSALGLQTKQEERRCKTQRQTRSERPRASKHHD